MLFWGLLCFSDSHTQTQVVVVEPHLAVGAWRVLRVMVDLAGPISQASPLTALLPEVHQLKHMGACERMFIGTSKPCN